MLGGQADDLGAAKKVCCAVARPKVAYLHYYN